MASNTAKAKKKETPLPPVPDVEEPAATLCAGCFPHGLAEVPEGATVVSCAHGAWRVADLVEQQTPEPVEGQGDDETPPAE
ncbi:hypothetical protein [Microtetraspora glauca]|uniref:Uncharacterized protein n=1 Tax=Microtetraspora glauca TaxID=1996 RepID=A0ABV3GA49_MICGL